MTQTRNYLAIDLGAESGRAIVGALNEGHFTLTETHRFTNGPVRLNDGLHWDGFLHPGDMPSRIQKFCADTNQRAPKTKGEIIRIALESIALKYRLVLERLEELTRKHLDPIHTIGGGTKNRLLNQFTANATGRTVITGPVEATAIGNILMQTIGMNHVGSLAEAREVVRASFDPEVYEPRRTPDWDRAYAHLQDLMKR